MWIRFRRVIINLSHVTNIVQCADHTIRFYYDSLTPNEYGNEGDLTIAQTALHFESPQDSDELYERIWQLIAKGSGCLNIDGTGIWAE